MKLWIDKLHKGVAKGETSCKLYRMHSFIVMMCDDTNFDLPLQAYLAICLLKDNYIAKQMRTTSRWVFIIVGRTEESFLNVLKMKSVLFNFYLRYKKGSIQDGEEIVDTMEGYILFDRDVTEEVVYSTLSTKDISKHIFPFSGVREYSEMDSKFPLFLGNDQLHKVIVEYEDKWKNRGICEFAL